MLLQASAVDGPEELGVSTSPSGPAAFWAPASALTTVPSSENLQSSLKSKCLGQQPLGQTPAFFWPLDTDSCPMVSALGVRPSHQAFVSSPTLLRLCLYCYHCLNALPLPLI